MSGLAVKSQAKLTMAAQLVFLPSIMLSGIMFPQICCRAFWKVWGVFCPLFGATGQCWMAALGLRICVSCACMLCRVRFMQRAFEKAGGYVKKGPGKKKHACGACCKTAKPNRGRPVLPGRPFPFLMVGRPRRRLQQGRAHTISAGASGARAFARGVIQIVEINSSLYRAVVL